jgi:hypothetical protein
MSFIPSEVIPSEASIPAITHYKSQASVITSTTRYASLGITHHGSTVPNQNTIRWKLKGKYRKKKASDEVAIHRHLRMDGAQGANSVPRHTPQDLRQLIPAR